MRFRYFVRLILIGFSAGAISGYCAAQSSAEDITVIVVTPGGTVQRIDRVPYAAQTADGRVIDDSLSLDLTEFLNANLASVSVNTAQNNPLQPDLQYRGFTVSPLLGLPQGLAVYQNGVRVNEPLGDAVNWDLLPESAVAGISLSGGANPVFGLNSLGGALSITMKDGFTSAGNQLQWTTGDWGRDVVSLESGGNDGVWAYYLNLSHFDERGWRDISRSAADNVYVSLGWRPDDYSTLDLVLQRGQSELRGNGPAPVGLLALDRSAVFTAPDITENDLTMVSLTGNRNLSDDLEITGSVFQRRNLTDSFNGDASEFTLCRFVGGSEALLELEDSLEQRLELDLGLDPDDFCDGSLTGVSNAMELESWIANAALQVGLDPEGFEFEDLTDELSGSGILSDQAINNLSRRRQTSSGLDLQVTRDGSLFERRNRLVTGLGFLEGESRFHGIMELASMDPVSRSTAGLGTGTYVDEAQTDIDTRTTTFSLFFLDSLEINEAIGLTLSGRFNAVRTRLQDRSGVRPELNGRHRFNRFNPALGLTWSLSPLTSLYLSYNEANRVPTPIELSCNESVFEVARNFAAENGEDPDDVEFECRLPNAFLADPPLDDVLTRNVEAGLRGFIGGMNYSLGVFRATNFDDIIFQTTGRATGLFANVDTTRRQGIEAVLQGSFGHLDFSAAYSLVDATFEDDFRALSPNHEEADAAGTIAVERGDRIPGIPRHQLKINAAFALTPALGLNLEAYHNSSQFMRGDESNRLRAVGDISVVNLRATYQARDSITVFMRINNLFDRHYESFGLVGESPDQVLDFLSDNTPYFLGAGAPRGTWLGVRLQF